MANSILIGDAGGTKTAWRLISNGTISQYHTVGFNAFTHSIEEFKESILANIPKQVFSQVYLYCAGADTMDQRQEVAVHLSEVLGAPTLVENDLLGAARATCGKEPGFACILGTGANASYYNGTEVEKVSASLGYVLGDEGSGMYLGKQLLKGVYRNLLSKDVIEAFQAQFNMSVDQAIRSIYDAQKPNQYLASFVPFILGHKSDPTIYQMVYSSFKDFFEAFLSSTKVDAKVHFVGSVAYHFSDTLRQVAVDLNYSIGTIIDSPIAGLVLYHQDE